MDKWNHATPRLMYTSSLCISSIIQRYSGKCSKIELGMTVTISCHDNHDSSRKNNNTVYLSANCIQEKIIFYSTPELEETSEQVR